MNVTEANNNSIIKYSLKTASTVVLVLLLTLPPLVNLFISDANAGTFTSARIQINNSQAAATGVTYTGLFTASTNTAIKRLTIQFCTTASGACVTPSGMTTTGASFVTDNISNTTPSNTFTGNGTLQRDWTGTTVQSPLAISYAVTNITNPSTINTTSYARITTYSDAGVTQIDSATVAFAVLTTTSVAVTATVDPNFTFSVAGVAVAGNFNGGSANINTTSTANTIAFGTIATGSARIAAQDLTVTTNAGSGYTITASHAANTQGTTAPLISGATNNIDPFTGTNTSPTTWTSPVGTTANTNTGFLGYSTEDASLCTGTATRFTSGGAKWAGSTTIGQEIVCSAAGVSAETTRVGWEVEANTIQPAGSYTGTVIYVATPTY